MTVRLTETTPLGEAKISPSGRMRVHAITAGLGSSGYYSPDVLREAAEKKLIATGTPLFFDHPGEHDRVDRPERSVRDIAAVFTSEAAYDETDQALVGEIQVFGPYRELLTEMAPHIGLSIHGSATDVVEGEVDGRRVPMIEGLAAIDSVDWVTRAGRGGKVVALLESARAAAEHDITDVPATRSDSTTTTTEETTEVTMGTKSVEESEYTRLTEAAGRVDALEAERDTEKARADQAEQKLAEAVAEAAKNGTPPPPAGPPANPRQVIEAKLAETTLQVAQLVARERGRSIIAEELAEAWVATSTRARLATELIESLPLVEGKLDENSLRTQCVEARTRAELEAAETLDAAGYGTPRGMGGMPTPTGGDASRYDQEIAENAQVAFGLSETEAAAAVKGR